MSDDPGPDDEQSGLASPDLDKLYRAESPRLVRYFRRRLRENQDALDLVQEAFIRFAGAISGQTMRHPQAYLLGIARNLLLEHARRGKTRDARLHVPIGEHLGLATPPEQSWRIEVEDVKLAYRRAVNELPALTREIFLLYRADGLNYREIGERLDMPIATVQRHFVKALAHIVSALEQE